MARVPSLYLLLLLALAYRLAVVALLELASSLVPLFDPTPDGLLARSSRLQPFVRWDVLWFVPVALRGRYATEQETAFGWGWLGTMRALGGVVWRLRAGEGGGGGGLTVEDVVLGGMAGSWLAGLAATALLYELTRRLTHSAAFARTTTALYVLSPSPAALVAPYTEPLYACLTFSGMLAVVVVGGGESGAQSSSAKRAALVLGATAAFAGSTAVRPTGILNAGYLIWALVIVPWLRGLRRPVDVAGRLVIASVVTCAVAAPFVHAQHGFYRQFCLGLAELDGAPPVWCAGRLPLLYTHVQRTYWNVGFLAYWELKQTPNFAIAGPLYGLLAIHHWTFLRGALPGFLRQVLPSPVSPTLSTADSQLEKAKRDRPGLPPPLPWLAPALLPFVLHSAALTLILLLDAHVQILLRLAQTNPAVYWAAAGLMGGDELPWQAAFRPRAAAADERPARETSSSEGRSAWPKLRVSSLPDAGVWYLRWVVGWGAITTVLWAGFFPPA